MGRRQAPEIGEVDRLTVIQQFLNRHRKPTYLEIGVKRGQTFLEVRARWKIAVDPELRLPGRWLLSAIARDPRNLFNKYFALESDRFFDSRPPALTSRPLNVVFVDGLHTFEQSLRDVRNSLRFLAPDGVIVLHDCNPLSESAAQPLELLPDGSPGSLPGWSGDVWKTIVHLRSSESELRAAVLDCDCGLGVVFRGRNATTLPLTSDQIQALDYRDLDAKREELLNLQPPDRLPDLLRLAAS